MPNLNGKGPLGEGPMTGRGRGRCRKKQSTKTYDSDNQLAIEKRNFRYGLGRGFQNERCKERKRLRNRE